MLQTLRGVGKHLYIATSKPTEFAVRILKHFGLSVFFDYIGGASFDRSRESKVEVIRYLLRQSNITDMDSVIMVGDRKFDVAGAHAVGMECIGVPASMKTGGPQFAWMDSAVAAWPVS